MNSQNITRGTGFLGKMLGKTSNKKEKFSLKTFIAAIFLVGIVTTATVGNVQEVWGSDDSSSSAVTEESTTLREVLEGLLKSRKEESKVTGNSNNLNNRIKFLLGVKRLPATEGLSEEELQKSIDPYCRRKLKEYLSTRGSWDELSKLVAGTKRIITNFSEEARISNFVDYLQKSLPGLGKLHESSTGKSGKSGNILFYKTSRKQDIVMLTSGDYSPETTRKENLKKLGISSKSKANVYSLSAIDTVFLCDPEAEITGVREIKDEDERGTPHPFYKLNWNVRETKIAELDEEEWETSDGKIGGRLAKVLLPSLIKYLEAVVREVTPDALIDRICDDMGFNKGVNGALCVFLKDQIGQQKWYDCRDAVRKCLTGTEDKPENSTADNVLFDLMEGKARLICKQDGVHVKPDTEGEIFKSDEKTIINFISSLRGGKSQENPKPTNACIVADVAIGKRVIAKLRESSKLWEIMREKQEKFDSEWNESGPNSIVQISELCELLSYVFNGRECSNEQKGSDSTKLEQTEVDWLKRALHTEVQYAILQKELKLQTTMKKEGSVSSSSSSQTDSKLKNPSSLFIPSEENIVFSLLDPCVSCARTPLILGCKGDSKEDNLIFLYVKVDDNGNKRKVPYEPYLRYAFDRLNKKPEKNEEAKEAGDFPVHVLEDKVDINRRRGDWEKAIQEAFRLLKTRRTVPPIFLKWDGELK